MAKSVTLASLITYVIILLSSIHSSNVKNSGLFAGYGKPNGLLNAGRFKKWAN